MSEYDDAINLHTYFFVQPKWSNRNEISLLVLKFQTLKVNYAQTGRNIQKTQKRSYPLIKNNKPIDLDELQI